ncbi:MAG: DUF3068 domain-containing protein [Chloroflexi bacterium]|nr:DUF3068 domain-containing protein [Chloroflexota bacterium]
MSSQISRSASVTGIIGVVLLVFGIIWGTVIFDRFEKVPDDLNRVVDLEGTYTLVDTPFVGRLQANATLMALAASGSAGDLLSDPAIAGLLANPGAIAVLTDPAVLAAIADPTLLPALMAANPAVGALLSDPAIQSVLANPVVGGLLADPDALGLIVDPRTQQILANPANLPTVDIPVRIHRVRTATRTDGDILYLNETLTTTNLIDNSDMGLLDPRFGPAETTLVVDRVDKNYLTDLMDEGKKRSGQWGLPFNTDKDAIYPSWISFAGQPLDAVYDRTDSTNGLETYVYIVNASSVPLGVDDPAGTGFPLVFDTVTVVWVEPTTGAGVDATVLDTISALAPDGSKYVRIANNLKYTDATVATLVDEAEDNKNNLVRFGTWLPIGSGVLGIGLLVVAGVMYFRTRARQTPAN